MKRNAYIMIAMIVLVGSLAVTANAQIGSRTQLIANVPFDFSVGGQTLPAGEYTVRQMTPDSGSAIVQLRSRDGHSRALVQMNSVIGKVNDCALLIFHRYGNRYFFAQAWTPGYSEGLQAQKTRAERAAQREIASLNTQAETVALRVR